MIKLYNTANDVVIDLTVYGAEIAVTLTFMLACDIGKKREDEGRFCVFSVEEKEAGLEGFGFYWDKDDDEPFLVLTGISEEEFDKHCPTHETKKETDNADTVSDQ